VPAQPLVPIARQPVVAPIAPPAETAPPEPAQALAPIAEQPAAILTGLALPVVPLAQQAAALTAQPEAMAPAVAPVATSGWRPVALRAARLSCTAPRRFARGCRGRGI